MTDRPAKFNVVAASEGRNPWIVEDQPPPVPNDSRPIIDLVMEDLVERKRVGIERYGVPLQAHNGRNMLVDLYQELIDAVVYIRGEIEERPPDRGISFNEDQRRDLEVFVNWVASEYMPDYDEVRERAQALKQKYSGLPF